MVRTNAHLTRRALVVTGGLGLGGAALAACGGPGPSSESTSAPKTAKPATIEVLHEFGPNSSDGRWMGELLERIRQLAPHLTVTSTVTAGGSWEPLQTALAAGTPPDISETYVANGASLGAKKIAEPLQAALKSAKDWSVNDYFDGPREAFTYKGDLVLAPMFTAPMGVAVNLELLGRAGLAPPAAAWTWDTFADYAVKLTKRSGSEVEVHGAAMPTGNGFNSMNFFGGPLWSHGGDWADRGKGVVTFHQPEGVAALEMWVNVALKRQAAPTAQPENWKGLRGSPFANGLAALAFIASPALPNHIRDAAAFKRTTVQMPRQKKPGAHFYAHGFFALRASKEKEAAAEFIRLASLPEHVANWNVASSGMPTRKAAAARKEWQDHLRGQPLLAAFNETLTYMRSYPALPGWNEVSIGPEGIGQALLDAVQGKMAPRSVMEEAARRADALLSQQVK
ncbi:MAG: extracellular solute-binding protein [Chloroflexi bacterium]|nr:extracellular solute-binding protein [Chloroflexota bacterium]